CQHYYNIFLTF
nr:immunoglobulin light chain junction region [Macaca mulatta]MOV61282.1 immunoglobulin light chain junction region [Macaca mulatta]MOV61375.1 immunoglobulin light chain junction region [Macaca mulatta]MOV61482.1 immunoglobulin light chain junction region [Macaca mulatta]MOV62207.1 immunoglobulin light chain junction region [Macaca mulatta]